jgi:hypothetical protein
MTGQPPAVIDLELSDSDVQQDLGAIVRDMSALRVETMTQRKFSDEQKDAYLHLAYRLASGLKALADDSTVSKMQYVAETLNSVPQLMEYDPLQDGLWRRKQRRFVENLEDLLVGVVRDDFRTADSKHHILQAVKYLASEDLDPEEREEVYDSIEPFKGALPLEKSQGFLNRLFGRLLGCSYQAWDENRLVMGVDMLGKGHNPKFRKIAEERGYTTLKIVLDAVEYKYEKDAIGPHQAVGVSDIPFEMSKMTRVLDKIIRYTKPITYPVLGMLPRKVQEHLELNTDSFDAESAFKASWWTHLAAGAALTYFSPFYGIPVLIDVAARGLNTYILRHTGNKWHYQDPTGSLMLKPFFWPIESGLDTKKTEWRGAEIRVRQPEEAIDVPNAAEYLDKLARIELAQNAEGNLKWTSRNNFRYGKYFRQCLNANAPKRSPNMSLSIGAYRAQQAVSYDHEHESGGIVKNTSLICRCRERYLLTVIRRKDSSGEDLPNFARSVLKDTASPDQAIQSISEQFNPIYLRLRKYSGGKLQNDLEGVA